MPNQHIEFINPLTDPRWKKLVQTRPSSLFHSPSWINVLARTYPFQMMAAILYEKSRLVAGMPIAVISDPLGFRAVSLAFSDYCDPVSERQSHNTMLLKKCIRAYDSIPDHKIYLRLLEASDPPASLGFNLVKTAAWHGLALEGTGDEMFGRLHPEFRRAVRIAQKRGLTVRPLKKKELRLFFEMHLKVRKYKYRLLAQPFAFFDNIWKEFVRTGQGCFLGAFMPDGKLIAGHCLLYWRDVLVYKFGATDYDFPEHRASHLLHWEGIRLALRRGFRLFDLGLSDDDQPGLIRYKDHMGAEQKVIRHFCRSEGQESHAAAEFRAGLKEITTKMTAPEVPDQQTEACGNKLYRFFA